MTLAADHRRKMIQNIPAVCSQFAAFLDAYAQEALKCYAKESSLEKNLKISFEDLEYLQDSLVAVREAIEPSEKITDLESLGCSGLLSGRLQNLARSISALEKITETESFAKGKPFADIKDAFRYVLEEAIPLNLTPIEAAPLPVAIPEPAKFYGQNDGFRVILACALSMACDRRGNIFVLDISNEAVIKINTYDVPETRISVRNIKHPRCLCYDEEQDSMLIGSLYKSEIYTLSNFEAIGLMKSKHHFMHNVKIAKHRDKLAVLDIDLMYKIIIFQNLREYNILHGNGIAFMSDGRLLVTHNGRKRVLVYNMDVEESVIDMTFNNPSLIHVSPTDQVYVLDEQTIIMIPVENGVFRCDRPKRFSVACFQEITAMVTRNDALWVCGQHNDRFYKVAKFD